jgi:hypothetical protein
MDKLGGTQYSNPESVGWWSFKLPMKLALREVSSNVMKLSLPDISD